MNIKNSCNFEKTLKHPTVRKMLKDFENWNKVALPLMGEMSKPYISIQESLADAMWGKTGKIVLDYGCGNGTILEKLIARGSDLELTIALDPDEDTLKQVPDKLKKAGFSGKIELIRSSSMVPLSLGEGEIDSIVSGLGGIAYSGFHHCSRGILEGRMALKECLADCHRVLKPGGYLGFSSLVPDPDFKRIKRESMLAILKGFRLKALWIAIHNAAKIEEASKFMKVVAKAGWAHYLSEEDWRKILDESGFKIIEVRKGSYAGQGLVIVAQKK